MDWILFGVILTLSEHGQQIVTGVGVAVAAPLGVWLLQELAQRPGRSGRQNLRLPRGIAIPLTIYIAFAVLYFLAESRGFFHIEESLFKDYYYVGRVKDGETVGKGFLFDPNDGDRLAYVGSFKENRRTEGTFYYKNGDRYKGQWKNEKENGHGVMRYANGDTYDGDFVNGDCHGKGALSFDNGDTYDGDFVNNERTGKATLIYANGEQYEGDFVNGSREGNGVMAYANGDRYDGAWKGDQRHGQGTIVYSSQDSLQQAMYTGAWENDKRHGNGVIVWTDGTRWEGSFENDKPNGWGTHYDKDGTPKRLFAKSGTFSI